MRGLVLAAALVAAISVARAERETAGESATEDGVRIRVAAVGDVLFGRYLKTGRYRRVSRAPQPFAEVASVLSAADVAFANLECPVMAEPTALEVDGRSLTFRCEPGDAEVLADAGFDVISVANNHVLNLGPSGARETPAHLQAAGLRGIGAGASADDAFAPAVVDVDGARVAFLAFTTWTNGRRPKSDDGAVAFVSTRRMLRELAARVAAARDELAPDFVVVSVHWGWEGDLQPRDEQERAARAMIDAGADLVIGHHPHVIHRIERYRDGVIAYSLGNFLFDNPAEAQSLSVILDAVLERAGDRRSVAVTLHPVVIERDRRARSSEPKLATGKLYRRWRRTLRERARGSAIAADPAR